MSGKLLFPPEIRSRSIVLRTLPDQELEGEEIYLLTLVSVTGEAEISPVARNAEVVLIKCQEITNKAQICSRFSGFLKLLLYNILEV